MRPEDLDLLCGVTDPQLRPDSTQIAYVLSRMDTAEDLATSHVRLHDHATGADTAFTAGDHDDSPRWSPDGSQLALLRRAGSGEPAQLLLLPADGGEGELLTDAELGVEDLVWLPDGSGLVLAISELREAVAGLDEAQRARSPRRITELGFREDGAGWRHDRVRRAWRLDLADGSLTALTPADHDIDRIAVATDGASVLFRSARQQSRETDGAFGIHRVPIDGGQVQEVVPPGMWGRPVATPDGGLVVAGHADTMAWPAPPELYRWTPTDGLTQLSDADRDLESTEVAPQLLPDGSVLHLMQDRGAVSLVRVADDGVVSIVAGGAQSVSGWDASPDASVIVYTADHPTDPGELWLVEGGDHRVLTAHNEALRDLLLPVEHFTFERDGVDIDAWMVLPAGEASDVPLLVNIHGGPAAQYGFGFFDEFQVEAGAGYAVVGCNPRGSSGRGKAWATAVVGSWGSPDSVDMLDLEALADAAMARSDRISPTRVGVMGGSYGGYAVARMLARTDRYRSAIVERGLLSWSSFAGTSDIGAYFDRMYLGHSIADGLDVHLAASPVWTAGQITTPTLVIHSLEDHRCPPEQAYQLFSVLRQADVPSELLLFPDEGHELSRSGSPKHRRERFEAVLDWHGRYLLDER